MIDRIGKMAAALMDPRLKEGVKLPVLGVQNSLVKNEVA